MRRGREVTGELFALSSFSFAPPLRSLQDLRENLPDAFNIPAHERCSQEPDRFSAGPEGLLHPGKLSGHFWMKKGLRARAYGPDCGAAKAIQPMRVFSGI